MLAEFFGEIDVNRFFTQVVSHPVIAKVRTTPKQTQVISGTRHTDHSYGVAPAMCSILSAQQLPPAGGDTLFASMSAAITRCHQVCSICSETCALGIRMVVL